MRVHDDELSPITLDGFTEAGFKEPALLGGAGSGAS
jgi:hypothetical protein